MSTEVVQRIIEKFGTQQKLADALSVNQSVIAGWKLRGVVPARQQPEVLKAAQKLGVDLSPADFFDMEDEPDGSQESTATAAQ